MRILFVSACYKPYLGGIERVAEQLSRHLAPRAEVEAVGILTSFYRYPSEIMPGLAAEEAMDDATVFRLAFYPRQAIGFYHLDTGLVAPRMGEVIRRFNPTHMHYLVCDWFLPNLQAFLESRRHAAQVMTVFEHEFEQGVGTLPFKWTNRFLARRMNAVHVVSNRARDVVASAFGAPAERTVVIPLGVDVPEVPPERNGRGPVIILSVGRLGPSKGQFDLLQCFHRVMRTVDVPSRLVLVGDDAGDAARINEYVRVNGLGEYVLVTGRVSQEELDGWYRRSDVFALLTRDESFGLVFWEAMAAGLPVVTYEVGGPSENLKGQAFLVPRGDTAGIDKVLSELLADRRHLEGLSRGAYEFARRHASWDRTVDLLFEVYRGCRSSRNQRL